MKINFKNETDSCSIRIYDYIGDDGWGGGVTTNFIEEQLNNAGNKPINIYINSHGGEVFEGFAIYNILKRYEGYKTVYIDGIAASIASVIALCGNKLIMPKASMMMIHNASGWAGGTADDLKKVVQALEQINEAIRGIYLQKTNLSEEELTNLMDNETFMTSEQCLQYGFADEIIDDGSNTITNVKTSIKTYLDDLDKKIKVFNDLKQMYLNSQVQVDGNQPVHEETKELNKKSHWAWLK